MENINQLTNIFGNLLDKKEKTPEINPEFLVSEFLIQSVAHFKSIHLLGSNTLHPKRHSEAT